MAKSEDVDTKSITSRRSAKAQDEEAMGYDPFDERVVSHGTNYIESFGNLIKASIGTGFLLLPDAFRNCGLIGGSVGTIVLTLLCMWSLHVLVHSQYTICKRERNPSIRYPDAMKLSLLQGPQCCEPLSRASPHMINIFILFHQLGICCIFILFVAEIMKQLVDLYWKELRIELHLAILIIPCALLNLIPNMKILAILSVIGNVISFVCIGIMYYFMSADLPDISNRKLIGTFNGMALFIGTVLFSIEAPGVVIAVESEMKKPGLFTTWYGVLNVALLFIAAIYIPTGILGYWQYGSEVKSAVILYLPENALGIATRILYAVNILSSYPINCYVAERVLWDAYIRKKVTRRRAHYKFEFLVRLGITLLSVGLAAAVPLLSLLISLVGVISLCTLSFIFPGLMDLCLRYPDAYGKWNHHIYEDFILILCGLAALFIGGYVSISEIVMALIEIHKNDNVTIL